MPIWMAFLVVTLIWGTTPLAIQWSQDGVGYHLAVTLRIAIGAGLFLLLVPWLLKRPAVPRRVAAVATISGSSMFSSMLCVYWGARYVPSGLISVLFGLGPVITGLMAASWLGEPFTREKLLGSLLGLGGLLVFFRHGEAMGAEAPLGIAVIILSVVLYAAGNIGIKRLNQGISPLWVTAGSLWVAAPLFALTLPLSAPEWPVTLSDKGMAAILYLGLVANGIGFVCFYYLLSRVSAANATLVTLSAPAVALWAGTALNQEEIHGGLVLGTAMILFGLAVFQWGLPFVRARETAKK